MNKASRGDRIPVELFQILKDDSVKVLHSICQQIWKTQQWPQDWKRSVCIPIPKKGNAKECSNNCTIALISHTIKVMLKCSKPGFNSTWNVNFQMFKLDLEKVEESEIKLPTSARSSKKQESSRKISISISELLQSLWQCGPQQTGKFFKRWEYPSDLPPEKSVCRSRINTYNWTWNNRLDPSKLGKESIRVVYCNPAPLTYMQSISCKMPGWIKHRLEKYDADDTTIMSESEKEIKRLLIKVKHSEKTGLKLNIQKMKIMRSSPITS